MVRNEISPISLLSITLGIMLSLSAIYSGAGLAKADSVIATIAVGQFPLYPAYDPANGNIYVPNYEGNSVSAISGQSNTVISYYIPVGQLPWGIAFDPSNGNLYVANYGDKSVSIISGKTNSVIGVITPVGNGHPYGIAFDPANGNLYVTNYAGITMTPSVTPSL